MDNKNKVVLVTGCSSGIGRDMCAILSKRGFIVAASARNIKQLKDVSATMKMEINVTDEISIRNSVDQIVREYGKIDVLINNAGYSTRGAVEEVDINNIGKMFDVNVFGIIRMVQAVAPYMRQAKVGKIINIGSISGRFAQILNGGYSASKHAVEAINDALRMELKGFGIQSTVIEAGPMQTNFFDTLAKNLNGLMENHESPYRRFYINDKNYREGQKRMDSVKAAESICEIIQKENLKPRYKVAVPLMFQALLILPDKAKEFSLLRRLH